MHFGNIADMLWLSQVFENVNIADTLDILNNGEITGRQRASVGYPMHLIDSNCYCMSSVVGFFHGGSVKFIISQPVN